jgi:hypothetical protein
MIIIYGHRAYGRVDEYGGEYVQTSFAHVYFIPLFPTGSMWVTRETPDGGKLGLEIPLDGKSVLAAYLRTWGIVLAAVPFMVAPGVVTGLTAVALVALSLYAWTWRGLRGVLARKRSDFNLLAYGTRCEPAKMPSETRVKITAAIEARHAKLPGQRPVEDVARFGATDLDEAVVAYGLLRLAAISHNDPQAEAAAERLVVGSHEALPAGDGPYRESKGPELAPDTQLAQAVAHHTEQVAIAAERAARAHRRQRGDGFWSLPGMKAIVVAGMALVAGVMLGTNSESLFGADEITGAQLASSPPIFKYVAVTCDGLDDEGELIDYHHRIADGVHATDHVYACHLGSRTMSVIADRSAKLANRVEGRVQRVRFGPSYLAEHLRDRPDALSCYLDTKRHQDDLAFAIAGLVIAAAALGLSGFWLVRFFRARRRS